MATSISNFQEFKKELVSNPQMQQEFQSDPVRAIQGYYQKAIDKDVWIYRIVVLTLGLTTVTIVAGILVLISSGKLTDDKSIPTIFTALGSAAIGALAGLLAPSPRQSSGE